MASLTRIPGLRLTSLAGVRRACRVGRALDLVRVTYPDGATEGYLDAALAAGPRLIVVQQRNAIAVQGVHRHGGKTWDPDTKGWLYWPKAAEVTTYGDDTFTIAYGKAWATYRLLGD